MKQLVSILSGLALFLAALPDNKTAVAFSPRSSERQTGNIHHLFNIQFDNLAEQLFEDKPSIKKPLYKPHLEALEAAQAIQEELAQSDETSVHRIANRGQYE